MIDLTHRQYILPVGFLFVGHRINTNVKGLRF